MTSIESPAAGHTAPRRIIRRQPRLSELDPHRFSVRQRRGEVLAGALVPLLLLVAWQLAAQGGWINRSFFPAPSDIWTEARRLGESGELLDAVLVSLRRIVIGLLFGVTSGVFVGILMGTLRLVRAAFDPLLSALYTVPKLALLPLFLLIFGIGETPKVLVISVTVFFFVWISTMEAILGVPEAYREVGRSFRVSRIKMYTHVLLPAALPEILVGLQISSGVAVLVMVGVEFVQGGNGIGHLIWFSWSLFNAASMYVGIFVVAVMGLVLTRVVRVISAWLLPWAERSSRGATMV